MPENIEISQVQSREQLEAAFMRGLIKLYQDAFADPPYEESFDPEEVRGFFELYLLSGLLLISEAKDTNEVIGFVAAVPIILEEAIAKIAQENGFDVDKTWYYADLGVDKKYRRQKIASMLVQKMIGLKPAETLLMRTSENNIASQRVNMQQGFELVEGMEQQVEQLRQDGLVQTDRRIFLSRAT